MRRGTTQMECTMPNGLLFPRASIRTLPTSLHLLHTGSILLFHLLIGLSPLSDNINLNFPSPTLSLKGPLKSCRRCTTLRRKPLAINHELCLLRLTIQSKKRITTSTPCSTIYHGCPLLPLAASPAGQSRIQSSSSTDLHHPTSMTVTLA